MSDSVQKIVALFSHGVISVEDARAALNLEVEDGRPTLRERVKRERRRSWNCRHCGSLGIPAAAGNRCWNCGRERFSK